MIGYILLSLCLPCLAMCNTSNPYEFPFSYIFVEKEPGVFVKEYLNNPPENVVVNDSDVKFYIYTQKTVNKPIEIEVANASLVGTPFSTRKPTCFLVHGWLNNVSSDVNSLLKNAILKSHDINVVVVDWSEHTFQWYHVARGAVPGVAKIIAKLAKMLEEAKHLTLDRTSIIGHSLGAHVAGMVGAALGGQLDHIIGLDPAWPLFNVEDLKTTLDRTDAKYVQVIHTCAGYLGIPFPVGHSDYFPNGGRFQEGCGLDDVLTGICSHGRAYLYYEESLKGSKFTATKCSDYLAYEFGKCKDNPRSWMGGYDIDKSAKGVYYLDTNGSPPYATV